MIEVTKDFCCSECGTAGTIYVKVDDNITRSEISCCPICGADIRGDIQEEDNDLVL